MPAPTAHGCCFCRIFSRRWRSPCRPASIPSRSSPRRTNKIPFGRRLSGRFGFLPVQRSCTRACVRRRSSRCSRLRWKSACCSIAALAAALHAPVPAHVTAQSTPLPASFGIAGFVTAMTLAVWMSDGWEVSASTSEEVNDTSTASGRGGITGLVFSTPSSLLACMYAFEHLGSLQGFADNQADALAYVGSLLGGPWWRVAIVVTVLLSTLSTLWTTILYLTRSVYAMGRDGVLPRTLGALDARDEPLWSMGVVAVLVTLCELVTGFSKSAADQLTLVLNASSVFLGLLFVLTALAAAKRFLARAGCTAGRRTRAARWGDRASGRPGRDRSRGRSQTCGIRLRGSPVGYTICALARAGTTRVERPCRKGNASGAPNKPRQRPHRTPKLCHYGAGSILER